MLPDQEKHLAYVIAPQTLSCSWPSLKGLEFDKGGSVYKCDMLMSDFNCAYHHQPRQRLLPL